MNTFITIYLIPMIIIAFAGVALVSALLTYRIDIIYRMPNMHYMSDGTNKRYVLRTPEHKHYIVIYNRYENKIVYKKAV